MRPNPRTWLFLSALLTSSLAAPALASGATLSPQSIIVNPAQTDLTVRVWVGKDAQGQGTANYRIGEQIRVGVQTSQDAYVYLFDINANGEISLFVPNGYDGTQGNFVPANTRTVFPGEGAQYTLTVGGPRGQDRILALASRQPLDLSAIADFAGSQGFGSVTVQGEAKLGEVLSGAVSDLGRPGLGQRRDVLRRGRTRAGQSAAHRAAGGARSASTAAGIPTCSCTPACACSETHPAAAAGQHHPAG